MLSKPDEAKIDPHHYRELNYLSRERWASYREAVRAVIADNPEQILEVGPGNKIVTSILSCLGFKVITLDINANVIPDVVGSLDELPFRPRSFDLIIATQVLEHLPFDRFFSVLNQFCFITKRTVVLSLPHAGPFLSVGMKIPTIPHWRIVGFQIPFIPIVKCNRDHCWEIGCQGNGVSADKIRQLCIDAGFLVEKDFRFSENPYHHFYILRKAS